MRKCGYLYSSSVIRSDFEEKVTIVNFHILKPVHSKNTFIFIPHIYHA